MENVTPQQKEPVMKGLALAGLVAIIIFLAWISIQIVQIFPAALNSLASLANSVYNYNPALVKDIAVKNDKSILMNGESTTLSWPAHQIPGTYTFSYECTTDINISLSAKDKDLKNITCGESYELGNIESLNLVVDSKATKIVSIPYSISFFRTNAANPTSNHKGTITVTNSTLSGVGQDEEVSTATSSEPVPEEPTPLPEVLPETEVETKPVSITPTKPTVRPTAPQTATYIYQVPTSNPKGTVDLAVTYLGIGTLNSKQIFTKTNQIKGSANGAIQYSVHNIGTKTSDSWTYTATLPGGAKYTSKVEAPLKPNERAIITLQFGSIKDTSNIDAKFSITTKTDENDNNNSVSDRIKLSN